MAKHEEENVKKERGIGYKRAGTLEAVGMKPIMKERQREGERERERKEKKKEERVREVTAPDSSVLLKI